jgi:hypothetical protein
LQYLSTCSGNNDKNMRKLEEPEVFPKTSPNGFLSKKFTKCIKIVYSTSRCTSRTSLGLKYLQKTRLRWKVYVIAQKSVAFFWGGKSRKTWYNLVFDLQLQRHVMSGFWGQNTRKRLGSEDNSAPVAFLLGGQSTKIWNNLVWNGTEGL